MTLLDHLSPVHLRPVHLRPVPCPAGPAAAADLAEADALIADLTALVDAGLVTARRQLGGPIRYRPVADLGDAA